MSVGFTGLMGQPSRLKMLLLGQASILLISFISALFPQYYFLVAIAYAIIIAGVFSYSARKMSRRPAREELGRVLFRENNAIKIAMFDKELHDELMKQMKSVMFSMGSFILVLILFPAYRAYLAPYVNSILESYFTNEQLASFLNFLIMYEFIFLLMSIIRIIISRKYPPVQIMLPQKYIVYRRGILVNDRFFTEFTKDHCYEYNPQRHYIEIRGKHNPAFKLRLYSENIAKLKEILDEEKTIPMCEEP